MKTLQVVILLSGCIHGSLMAQDIPATAPNNRTDYSTYSKQDFPNQVFFGDTHVHTKYSPDAGMAGTSISPDEAYRFAKGASIVSSTGIPVRLGKPLDWLVITDHAENLGLPVALERQNSSLLATELGQEMATLFAEGTVESARAAIDLYQSILNKGVDPFKETDFAQSSWNEIMDAAENHNIPGGFTAFIGFEWTTAPNGNNLHRNIIFREGKTHASQVIPLSAYDTEDPEDLWRWMEEYETKTGGRMLAIAHNGNLSNGQMFDDKTMSGDPLTAEYARRRSKYEPLYEVTQTKGDGEAHPFLSPNDDFADFETWDKGSFGPVPKSKDMLPREYAREAYKRGLAYESQIGENPFKFGMVGSTDTHTGLSTSQEDNFFGKIAALEPTADPIRFNEPVIGRLSKDNNKILAWQANAAGIAAVWARENTREAIFDAMARREIYATTGTRIRVRVFAGYDFSKSDLQRSDFDAHGYAKGVPMGAELNAHTEGKTPTFLIRALRDPDGANLDRIQVVKGWLNEDGTTEEKIYNVAWAGERSITSSGKLPSIGNTVNVENASYTNEIGSAALGGFWKDPDFNPEQKAFYYIRVLEIPTPRWTAYDAKFFHVDLKPEDKGYIQERAYTSPIWYNPGR